MGRQGIIPGRCGAVGTPEDQQSLDGRINAAAEAQAHGLARLRIEGFKQGQIKEAAALLAHLGDAA
jgi:hypothetical protein